MANFRRVIRQAYLDILDREGDQGGVEHYNGLMNGAQPLSEASLRESLVRSPEYSQRFPDVAPPPPPPGPGSMVPLRVQGSRFVRSDNGAVVKLLGMVVAGDDPLTPGVDEGLALGWPMLTHEAIDLMAAHRLNYSVFRLGPNIDRAIFGDGEAVEFCGYERAASKYDLSRWHEPFWELLAERLAYARSKGLYICLSAIDSWNLDHEVTPWSTARNVQAFEGGSLDVVRRDPHAVHESWLRKLARTVAQFENVLIIDGNESFKGHPTPAWVAGIRDILASEFRAAGGAPKLFGTNSGLQLDVDFVVLHDQGLPDPGAKPIIVDEYPTRPVTAILVDAKLGHAGGKVAYIYWKGEHSIAERDRCLAGLKLLAEGGDPHPIPESCPPLTKMGIQPLQWLDQHFQPLPGPAGARRARIDLTPKFGNPPKRCNDEDSTRCGGRPCEDPRGGAWEVLVQPPGPTWRTENNGFLFRMDDMVPGAYRIRCSPHPDSHDALGKPHTIGSNAPQTLEWNV